MYNVLTTYVPILLSYSINKFLCDNETKKKSTNDLMIGFSGARNMALRIHLYRGYTNKSASILHIFYTHINQIYITYNLR